jgi:hypothetical protein
MFAMIFKCFSRVSASVSDTCFKCFICFFMLQVLHLDVSKVDRVSRLAFCCLALVSPPRLMLSCILFQTVEGVRRSQRRGRAGDGSAGASARSPLPLYAGMLRCDAPVGGPETRNWTTVRLVGTRSYVRTHCWRRMFGRQCLCCPIAG